jgi:hypothetical protein
MEGWTQSPDENPAWKYQSGAFISGAGGSIGRDLELPDEFSLSFDAEWRNNFNMSVILFSDDVSTETPENGYELTFQRGSARLQRCGTHNWIGQTQRAQSLKEDEKARIEIRASVRTKTIVFYVNDRPIEVWTDPNLERESLGRAIHFVTQDNSPVKISRLEIARWDGTIEEMPGKENALANRFRDFEEGGIPAELIPEKKVEDGRMTLRNGDSIAGEVVAIAEGLITLKTAYSEVKLPVARLRTISLKPVSLEEPKRMNGDVRGWFLDGSSLVFRLDRVEPDKISGFSQNFGSAEFNPKAFTRIEFNIYNPKLGASRAQDPW